MRADWVRAVLHLAAAYAIVGPATAAAETYTFDIPSSDAESAILAFSLQTHRLILAPGEPLAGLKTPEVKGSFSALEALSLLLKDTGVEVVSDDGKTIILNRKMAAAGSNAAAIHEHVDPYEVITVTGFRASLAESTNAKRAAVGFSDSVFAEDIGKFPDTNIAESLNRIPGITINRDVNGEGVNVQIRGLGQNFTKILINGNPIAVASTGPIDSTHTNREVDLNIFPTELFTQLTVSKSPMADQIEGGAAGSVSMRVMRPFDKPGFHASYDLRLTDQSTTNMAIGKRGALIVSDTEGAFGVLLGVAGVQSNMFADGWEDGNASWYGPNLPSGTCAAAGTTNACAQFGSKTWTIPDTIKSGVFVPVPSGYALDAGYTANVVNGTSYLPINYPVTQSLLYALNPDLADSGCAKTAPSTACLNQMSTRLSNALLPRLGRTMYEKGSRDRYNGTFALEFWPSDQVHAYLDVIFGKTENHMDRSDMGWGVRTGNSSSQMIPVGLTLSKAWLNSSLTGGLGGSVQTGTFYNPTFGLEARDYRETGDFINLNPGMSWHFGDLLTIDTQANYSSSHFFRRNPTVMVSSCTGGPLPAAGVTNCNAGFPATGTSLTFDATGAVPTETPNVDLNDPNNFEWNLGRVNLNGEKRWTTTQGAHLDVTYGGDKFAVKVGAAYDVAYRLIRGYDDSGRWQSAICGGNPNVLILGPNSGMPNCTGQSSTEPGWSPSGWANTYTAYGTGYTAGWPALAFSGSLVPTSDLPKYLRPGPNGFISVDYDKIFAASNYWPIMQNAVAKLSCVPRCDNSQLGLPANTVYAPVSLNSTIDERTVGIYGKVAGSFDIGERKLKYDVGLRWVETRQYILSPSTTIDPRNADLSIPDGGRYPNYQSISAAKSKYHAYLPSVSLVYELADDFQVRASLSRTMTRPNPGDMRATMDFGDPIVSAATLGNPKLKPFFSNNYDVGAELYTGGEGYVGLAMFRKSISGFTAQITSRRTFSYLAQYGITYNTLGQTQKNAYALGGPSGVPCNDDASCANQPLYVNQQVNLPGLEIINGLEANLVQSLDFLTIPYLGMTGFGFTGNLTVIDQESTGSVPTFAIGVPPYQFNVTGYYEGDGIMLRLAYNWNDTSYGSSSQSGNICLPTRADGVQPAGCPGGAYLFTKAYGQADISSRFALARLFGEVPSNPELTFDVQNLFNAKQRSYLQFPDTIHSYYISGRTFLLGVRGSF